MLVHLFLSQFFLLLNFALIYLNAELCEDPASYNNISVLKILFWGGLMGMFKSFEKLNIFIIRNHYVEQR